MLRARTSCESRMREIRTSGLMRERARGGHWLCLSFRASLSTLPSASRTDSSCGEQSAVEFLSQTVIQTAEQMRNRFLGFIAHVRETKRFAFDRAVAAVDDKMMFGAQIAN